MTTHSKTKFKIIDLLTFAGLAATSIAMIEQMLNVLHLNDTIVGGTTLTLSMAAGASSLYISRLVKKFSRKKRIYLSFSYDEIETAKMLKAALEKKRAIAWFGASDTYPGVEIDTAINSAIEGSNILVVFVSRFMSNNPHVKREVEAAIKLNIPIVAITIPSIPPPEFLSVASRIIYIERPKNIQDAASQIIKAK